MDHLCTSGKVVLSLPVPLAVTAERSQGFSGRGKPQVFKGKRDRERLVYIGEV